MIRRMYPAANRIVNILMFAPTEKSPVRRKTFARIPVNAVSFLRKWPVKNIEEIISPDAMKELLPASLVTMNTIIPIISSEQAIRNQTL
ncbi:MAG TPA: hypothetical protein VK213_08525 [Bacteroidales bacterium]|nr:hypothetical protein [Bacteroidales bacterium]